MATELQVVDFDVALASFSEETRLNSNILHLMVFRRTENVNPGHDVSDQTGGNILKQHGIEPADDRKRQTTWKTSIKSHWNVLATIDFTTIEVWTKDESNVPTNHRFLEPFPS